jgi:RNA recognition motif-containing protein
VRVLPGKGYGFVNFENVQGAIAAVNGLNGFKIGNKHLKVEFKKPTPLGSPLSTMTSSRTMTPTTAVTVPTKI